MRSLQRHLAALREGKARRLLLRQGAAPLWDVTGTLVQDGDPLPAGADYEALLKDLLRAARVRDGRVDAATECVFDCEGARFHAALLPGAEGCDVTLRIVPEEIPGPDELGLPKAALQVAAARSGLVLVAGTRGSGRTTALASLLELINTHYRRFLVTVERPLERVFVPVYSVVHQIEVGVDVPTGAAGLAAALAARAQVLAVDPLDDALSALLALEAADRGALVFAVVEAAECSAAVARLLALLGDAETGLRRCTLAQVLRLVVHVARVPGRAGLACATLRPNRTMRNALRENRLRELATHVEPATGAAAT